MYFDRFISCTHYDFILSLHADRSTVLAVEKSTAFCFHIA